MVRSLPLTLSFMLAANMFAQSPGGVNTNLQLWLRAEGYTGNSTWTDNSGNNRHASKTGTVANTASYNFQPVPTGLTAANYFSVPHTTSLNTTSGAISVFAVGLPGGGTYSPFVSKTINQYWDQGWVLATSSPMTTIGFTTGDWVGTGGNQVALQTGASTTIPYIATGFGSGASTNVVSVCSNARAVNTSNSTKTSTTLPLYVGFDGDVYHFEGGSIAEVIVYNANLSVANRQQVWSYLAVKYGITLNNGATNYVNSSANTVWNTATNAGYNNNIFGIGRDNTSGLHQRQSVSINGGLQPVIAHGSTLVALNSSGSDLGQNNSFLIAGSNNSAAAFDTWLSGIDGLNARLDRIWRVQESGSIGTVTIAWPSTDPNIQLLVSNDATFNGSDNAYATTTINIDGTDYRQASVDIVNGQYFTFATTSTGPGGYWNSLALWLTTDAAGVQPGNNAPAWNDLSRTNNPVERVGTRILQMPDASHNFQPYFNNFSSADHFKDSNSSIAPESGLEATAMTMFAVARINHATNDGRIMGVDDGENNGNDPGLSIDDASARFHRVSTSTVNLTSPIDAQVGRSGIFSAYTSGSTVAVGMDGNYNTSTMTTGGGMRGDVLMIGYGNATVVGALPGDLQEVIWYKRALNSSEIKQVESYLAIKHGITLGGNSGTSTAYNYVNSAGTTIWNKSTNSGYNNDIAGIGRDDVSRLYQKQSNSVNSSGSVTMALGNIAASNAMNASTFMNDRSFLIWGHDGAAHNSVFNDPNCFNQLPVGVEARIQRKWKVQATDLNQTVTVAFDQSALIGHLPVSNLRLLVDNDGSNWTNATIYSNATVSGGRVVFAGVDLTNAPFFTIATTNFASTPLPIELLGFEGITLGAVNELTWRTASETNNDHFVVERGADGIWFEHLGRVNGAGNSQQLHSYRLWDEAPLNGLNYYRLKQVDFDGTFTHSPVIVLNNERSIAMACKLRTLESEGLFVFDCTVSEGALLELFNPAGQPLGSYRFGTDATIEVDLRAFVAGMYFARITDGAHAISYKLLRL